MIVEAMPHAYPKGSMGLCPFCGKSKLNKLHVVIKCSSLTEKEKFVFQCNFPIRGNCPNCIRPYCARHLGKHRCE